MVGDVLRKTFGGLGFGGGVVVEEVCCLVGMAGCRERVVVVG